MRHRRTIQRILAVLGALFAFAAVVVVAGNVGHAADPVLPANSAVSTDSSACPECAECTAEPSPATPEPTPAPALAPRHPASVDRRLDPTHSPTADPPRWDRFQFTFRVDIDAKLKPKFNEAKSSAFPANRWDAIDEIKAGEDRRHNCYTLTFDGPPDMECDETNRTGDFFSDEAQETGVKFTRLSAEIVKRDDGETVKRFVYRYPRFQRAGFYDLYLHCKTPAAP